MKLSFTTLGCPGWSLDQIVRNAVEYGFDAIDFRGLQGEMNVWKLPELSTNVKESLALIKDAGLKVSCFSSSVQAVSAEKFEQNLEEVKEYTRLCEAFGTPYIRVFGGKIGDLDRTEATRLIVKHLKEMAQIAAASGAKVLVETHDDWTDCRYMQPVMEQVNHEGAGVLWDLHHPYRTIGEKPEDTWNALGQWIEYTHVKDSVKVDGTGRRHPHKYVLTGQGDIPLKGMFQLLKDKGYEGYYVYEWEKAWYLEELEEPEVAFPQYAQYMRSASEELR
ncbi:sugar phosphate isomerase/epimerase family protein [Paenibacillus radicis (ex Xue et al. 2023)]|uniref:Sugar phosphate isomerase/epimerase n=1 Tax=Paenibacillus radicis (ex Xue et al. 2023) TaxID=2972489 RepID=A0ABT1YSJ1_9BACL|nr:sugar phosphate isomerase/epimerase family protein [Paenibacillus radicis (ex Xue et al. 2023)]MCR8635324.1 sugar phosphate isomerase/epimerase [Paenibacillus radicis (ex Xue et al. 2023)]